MFSEYFKTNYKKTLTESNDVEIYRALLRFTKKQLNEKRHIDGKKKLYYISAEFLIGKLLANNLINLGLYDEIDRELKDAGTSLAAIEAIEPEPSLGNGGLGRLAACFLDSIATLGLNGDGVGLNYHFGLFRQSFSENLQQELPNPWIEKESWLEKTDVSFSVPFKDFTLKSVMYDIDVAGYESGCNRLHLFDAETVDESIVKKGITFDKTNIKKNLTLFLYPDDSDEDGRLLRIYQQYFMVSNAAQLLLKEAEARGSDLHDLADYAVVQINDTHPTLVIPELIYLLGKRGITFNEAARIVSRMCAYTNHTILAEALEKWPLTYLSQVVPHLIPIIKKLDTEVKKQFKDPAVHIIDSQNRVHMAHIDIHCGFSINGVAALHTQILKDSELNHFYRIYPEKFNNKTNGITFRRWLIHTNPELTALIAEKIGTGFFRDEQELTKLLAYREDIGFLNALLEVKQHAKKRLNAHLLEKHGVVLDENAVYDIQIKRLHEYKRQQMNALFIIWQYLQIKQGKLPKRPIVCLFGAKAAPAYTIAKDIIHLILCLQKLIAEDAQVAPHLKVLMVENYNVTEAEFLIPACDISEQISLASKEASGTGNMKFMLNGAVTLGTSDGANVEIADLVGTENIYLFGKKSEEVIHLYETQDYCSKKIYQKSPLVKMLVDFITGPAMLRIGHKENLERIQSELLNKDWFMTLLDLEDYIKTKERIFSDYENRTEWAQKMLVNIAQAGFFSSDRTIAEYNRDIWKL
ncbi:MAG: glycogen/starch/alpha-glucan phosphorylase [Ruminococcaceae bacterium]|nr:glycogen/starch/alpha-glucan phosphorylase [Oscillospiraceae bacterium]